MLYVPHFLINVASSHETENLSPCSESHPALAAVRISGGIVTFRTFFFFSFLSLAQMSFTAFVRPGAVSRATYGDRFVMKFVLTLAPFS